VVAALPAAASEWLDQIVTGPMTAESVEEVMRGFKKALIERALGAEMSYHLGYPAGGAKPETTANQRNGSSGKTVLTDDGPLHIDIPRDRAGLFELQLIGKHERRFSVSPRPTHLDREPQGVAASARFHRCGSNSPIRLWG
jgi:transposase-like protein